MRHLYLCLCLLFLSTPAFAADGIRLEHSTVRLIAASQTYQPGESLHVGLHILLDEGWHTYSKNPGDAGIPTTLTWQLPEGVTASELGYPPHETFTEGDLTTYGYSDEVVFPSTLSVASDVEGDVILNARAAYLICKEICIPQEANLSLIVPEGAFIPSEDVDLLERFSKATDVETVAVPTLQKTAIKSSISFPLALVLALAGGVLLNLMPCVFPVLSLKALSIAKSTSKERAHIRKEALAYTAGILVCLLSIAGVLIALGEGFGWGFQFQSPGFVGVMALLLFAIGLNLSGMFELPVLLGSVEIKNPHNLKGSFATGVLATLVATPCTAPFMAPALGYALTQPPFVSLATFVALGLGLALPFVLLAYIPALTRALPAPGAWLVKCKQALAFPMFASALWLAWVVGTQTGLIGMVLTLGFALVLALLIWLKRSFGTHTHWCHTAMLFVVLGLCSVLVQGLQMLENYQAASVHENAVPYSAEQLSTLRESGTPVFLDATASWCITCQVNYRVATGTDVVQQAFKDKGVVFMVADWTRKDPEITALLEQFGFKGVPMNVYFPPNGEPKVLPQVLSTSTILEALE